MYEFASIKWPVLAGGRRPFARTARPTTTLYPAERARGGNRPPFSADYRKRAQFSTTLNADDAAESRPPGNVLRGARLGPQRRHIILYRYYRRYYNIVHAAIAQNSSAYIILVCGTVRGVRYKPKRSLYRIIYAPRRRRNRPPEGPAGRVRLSRRMHRITFKRLWGAAFPWREVDKNGRYTLRSTYIFYGVRRYSMWISNPLRASESELRRPIFNSDQQAASLF